MIDYTMYSKPVSIDTFVLVGHYTNHEVLDNLKKDIIDLTNQGNELDYKTNVKGKFTGWGSLLNNEWFIKFMNGTLEHANKLYQKSIRFKISSAWGNVCSSKQDHVKQHRHLPTDCFSGIIYFDDYGPGTYFPEYDLTVKEKKGRFVFFHPNLLHGVKEFNYEKPRVTCAFNADFEKEWNF